MKLPCKQLIRNVGKNSELCRYQQAVDVSLKVQNFGPFRPRKSTQDQRSTRLWTSTSGPHANIRPCSALLTLEQGPKRMSDKMERRMVSLV